MAKMFIWDIWIGKYVLFYVFKVNFNRYITIAYSTISGDIYLHRIPGHKFRYNGILLIESVIGTKKKRGEACQVIILIL